MQIQAMLKNRYKYNVFNTRKRQQHIYIKKRLILSYNIPSSLFHNICIQEIRLFEIRITISNQPQHIDHHYRYIFSFYFNDLMI